VINFRLFPENTGDKCKPSFSLAGKEKWEAFNEFKKKIHPSHETLNCNKNCERFAD